MSGAEDDPADQADRADGSADPPLTVELLADLQAGLLDDDDAARVRRQVRADPAAERTLRALNQVRRDVAALGADSASAPDAPPPVVARIAAALWSAGPAGSRIRARAAHAARPMTHPVRVIVALAGLGALAAVVGLGTMALVSAPEPATSTPITAQHITVSPPASAIPLSEAQILGLLDRSPDYGPLAEAPHRASCLNGLGYPTSTGVLGARPIEINGRPGVLLVLPGDRPEELAVLAVAPKCSAADSELLASTHVPRP
jgi:hypothetical protein